MASGSNQVRWEALQARYRDLGEKCWRLDSKLQERYGSGVCWWVYCTRTETKQRDALRARQNKVIDALYILADQINPSHGLRSGTPMHTVCSKMTYEEVVAAHA